MTEPRQATPEDIDRLVALVRRTLKRLDTVEKRLASVEERLHWLDDLPEAVQGLQRLTRRVAEPDVMDKERIRQIARDAATKAVKERKQ